MLKNKLTDQLNLKSYYLYSLLITALISLSAFNQTVALPWSEDLPTLGFDELYASTGVLGFTFTDKLISLKGKKIQIKGFMAPPLKAEANFFVLTRTPMALCPFCSSDADWSADILIIYLNKKQTFTQHNAQINVSGILEYGSWTDPETGFVSQLRLSNAEFKK